MQEPDIGTCALTARGWISAGLVGAAVVAAGLYVTRPVPLAANTLDGLTGDATAGAIVFAASGCASCHLAPGVDSGPAPALPGGRKFASPFGTFVAPNISQDTEAGIGGWTDVQIASAVLRGVGAGGEHLYPAFPYTSYGKADLQDVVNLIAYLRTLPADPTPSQPHELAFPFNVRASLGGWKLLFDRSDWVVTGDLTDQQQRGRYLVEALGHCAECHTPRNALGGLDRDRWLSGAPNPSGPGRIPNITSGNLTWSEGEIAEYLSSGFTPEFDTAGGSMAEVVKNTAQLTDADRAAIAAYLKIVPAVTNP